MSHTASDARTDGLAAIARDLVIRVRDDDPAAARDPLLGLDPADVIEVVLILARMVPDNMAASPLDVLRARRQVSGISQRELADRLDTVQSAISEMENGAVSPTLRVLSRWAAAFGMRIAAVPDQPTTERNPS